MTDTKSGMKIKIRRGDTWKGLNFLTMYMLATSNKYRPD